MQSMRFWRLLLLTLFLYSSHIARGERISIQSGDCSDDPSPKVSVWKTPAFSDKANTVRFVGKLTYRRNAEDAKKKSCHVVYSLLVGEANKPLREVKRVEWDTEEGEFAGIDLVGFSPDGSRFAADFWLAAGDWVGPRPVVYDLKAQTASYMPLEDKIQKKINGCDQLEDFIGVTDQGEAVFAVPPSEYDDSPECGDKGLWHFNLQTGLVYRVKKISGDKWK